MNWRLSALDNFTLISNSDAHSRATWEGRQTFFIPAFLSEHIAGVKKPYTKEFYGTIEFFPEEGKYHYDGHRPAKYAVSRQRQKLRAVSARSAGENYRGSAARVEVLAGQGRRIRTTGGKGV
jgi:PHP family Zn ribbon phosphoesterase